MDVFAVNCIAALAYLFIPIWLLACIGIPLSLGLKARRRRVAGTDSARASRLQILILAAIPSYIVLMGVACFTAKVAIAIRFDSFVEGPPNFLVVSSPTGSREIGGSAAAELLRIVDAAASVTAHHSHPVDVVTITMNDSGYVYELGRDSDRPNEFWLTWVGYPGSGPPRYLMQVKQFHSDELDTWLKNQAID